MSRSIPSIFADALACETPEEVATLLDEVCGSDAKARHEVERLLAAHGEARGFMEPETALRYDPSIAIGKVVGGRYKLLEEIGEGGMGTVWVAEQTEPVRRKVALKLVKAGMDSKQVLVRFKAERQALALMDHPNIAKVLDGGVTENGRPFFAMEYVKGVPITRYCDDAQLPLRERLKLFVSVCQAVQHAHQKGIIHRDLKPSNILVCQYDGLPVVKVIDFGLAKAVNQPLTAQTLHTAHGIMIGTPLYMSPEQAEFNNLDVDTRTDVYSLGVVLYELLTGSTPLEKQQIQRAALDELLRLIKEVEPAKPSTRLSTSARLPHIAAQRGLDPKHLGRELKGDLDWIVMKALAKERGRRYETANGLARDLQRFMADEPVEACPPSTRYRLQKLMRRYRRPLAGAAAVGVALVLGIVATTAAMFEARRQTGLAQQAAIDEGEARLQAERAEAKATEQLKIARAEKARADAETARAMAAKDFMRNLLGPPGAWTPSDGRQLQDRRISDVIASAGAALEGLEAQPQLELDGRLTLATTYGAIGEFAQAQLQYQRALELSRKLHGPNADMTLQIQIDQLFVTRKLPTDEDLAHAQRLVATLTERHGSDDPMTCDAKNSLALLLRFRDNLDEARRIYASIVESVRSRPDVFHPKGKARYFFNLAQVTGVQGDEAEAEKLLAEACAVCDTEPHTDPWRCLQYYQQLGKVHVKNGRYEEALAAWQKGYERSAPLGLTPERTDFMDRVIELSGYLKRYDLARGYLEQLREGCGQMVAKHLNPSLAPLYDIFIADTMSRSHDEAAALPHLERATDLIRERSDANYADWNQRLLVEIEFQKRGVRDVQSWPSPALGTAAEMILYHTATRHVSGVDSPPLEWEKLSIDLYRWEGSEVEVDSPCFHGSLVDLSRFDPPDGLYMLTINLPRVGTFPAREAIWFLECDWDLAFYDGELLAAADDQWDMIARHIPFERKHGPVAAWNRINMFDHFHKYRLSSEVIAAARTEVELPPGTYFVWEDHDGKMTWWVDGATPSGNLVEFGREPRELKFICHLGEARCRLVVEPPNPARNRLLGRAIPSIHWVLCDVEKAKVALDRNPGDVVSIVTYARALSRAGQLDEAFSELLTLENQLPKDHYSLYQFATLAAYKENHAVYRKICRKLLDDFPEQQHTSEHGERSAKCCLLLPEEVVQIDPGELASRVDRAAYEPPGVNAPWYYMVKGIHQFRLGKDHSPGAIEWIDRSVAAFGTRKPPSVCYFVRAMALKLNGQEAEAAEAYRKAEEHHSRYAYVPGRDDLGDAFENWLIDEVFAREARAMFADTEPAASP